MTPIRTILVCLLLAASIGLAFVFTGVYDVAATKSHTPLTLWVLDEALEHSVERHAHGIQTPPLDDPELVQAGLRHYGLMCAPCHGGVGVDRSEFAQGMMPPPPKMTEVAGDWTPAQFYWIVKNGIKMSGMPGFGKTHTDRQLWAMVAAARRLPSMSPEEYQRATQPAAGDSSAASDSD